MSCWPFPKCMMPSACRLMCDLLVLHRVIHDLPVSKTSAGISSCYSFSTMHFLGEKCIEKYLENLAKALINIKVAG